MNDCKCWLFNINWHFLSNVIFISLQVNELHDLALPFLVVTPQLAARVRVAASEVGIHHMSLSLRFSLEVMCPMKLDWSTTTNSFLYQIRLVLYHACPPTPCVAYLFTHVLHAWGSWRITLCACILSTTTGSTKLKGPGVWGGHARVISGVKYLRGRSASVSWSQETRCILCVVSFVFSSIIVALENVQIALSNF